MFVVSDTSVISNLAIIGLLGILKNQFELVTVPMAVKNELAVLDRVEARTQIETAFAEGWLRVVALDEAELALAGTFKLHKGEAEAISLARSRNAVLLCMDERRGRAKAIELGIRIVGILGLLLREKDDGRLESIRQHLEALSKDSKFFMSRVLIDEVLASAGE